MLLLQLHIHHFMVLITTSKGIVGNKILTSLSIEIQNVCQQRDGEQKQDRAGHAGRAGRADQTQERIEDDRNDQDIDNICDPDRRDLI